MERDKEQIKLQQEMPNSAIKVILWSHSITAIVISVGYCDLEKAKRKKESQQGEPGL